MAQAFAKEQHVAVVEWPVMLRSKERPWALANVDRWICDDPQFEKGVTTHWDDWDEEPPGIQSILELKTSGIATHGTAHQWDRGQVPSSYLLQTYHYALVTGIWDIWFGALLAGQGLVVRHPQWNSELADALIDIEDSFWLDNVVPNVPPPVDGSDATEETLKLLYPSSVQDLVIDGGDELAKAWVEYEKAKEEEKEIKDRKKEAKSVLVGILGNASIGEANGIPVCSYKSTKDKEYFADEVFKQDHPDLYKEYTRTRPGWRTLRGL